MNTVDEPLEGSGGLPILLALPLFITFGTAALGNALMPVLVTDRPLILLALNSTTRHLVLTSGSVNLVAYLVVALGRRLLEDPFLYFLGRRYGQGSLRWITTRVGGGQVVTAIDRSFQSWIGDCLVVVSPVGIVCVLAGASRMSFRRFMVLNVIGTTATIILLRFAGSQVSDTVAPFLLFLDRQAVPATAISALVTGILVGWRSWRRKK